MKARAISLLLPMLFATVVFAFQETKHLGVWKLNETKSTIPAGAPKNTMVTYEAAGDMIKITVEGVDAAGQPTKNEWTGKFDGKEYPVTGDSTSDMRSYKYVDDRTLEFWAKKGGKETLSGRLVVSADGKTRTTTVTSTAPDGKKTKMTAVYDRQ